MSARIPTIHAIDPQDTRAVAAFEQRLRDGLQAYNGECGHVHIHRLLHLEVRDERGSTMAGLSGETDFGWLHICNLWVARDLRRTGIGTQLVEQAHSQGRAHGVTRSYLCTFDFQAEAFYKRLGYQVFGTLHDFPKGHRRIYLAREI